MQSRRYKPVKAARRAYSRGYGRSREEEGGPRIRTILLCALVALAIYLRFSPGETPRRYGRRWHPFLAGIWI